MVKCFDHFSMVECFAWLDVSTILAWVNVLTLLALLNVLGDVLWKHWKHLYPLAATTNPLGLSISPNGHFEICPIKALKH